jgi:hypothetical protein
MKRRFQLMKSLRVIVFSLMMLLLVAGCGEDETIILPTCHRPRINAETTVIPGGTTAVLKVRIDPKGSQTAYYCEYGKDKGLAMASGVKDAGSGEGPVEVYTRINSLEPFTHYYFRWRASNEYGESVGRIDTFTTVLQDPPLTYLSQNPSIDTVGTTIRIHLYWSGMDLDGQVTAYQWQRIDEGLASGWHTTTRVDSIFELETGFTEDWHFYVRAVDNDGLVDPAPPVYVFHAQNSSESRDRGSDWDLMKKAVRWCAKK